MVPHLLATPGSVRLRLLLHGEAGKPSLSPCQPARAPGQGQALSRASRCGLPQGTSPLYLLCLSSAGPGLYGLGSGVTHPKARCDNRWSPTSFIPFFLSGGASPYVEWAGSLPSLRGESGRIFWRRLSPPPLTQGPSSHFFLRDSVVRCQLQQLPGSHERPA